MLGSPPRRRLRQGQSKGRVDSRPHGSILSVNRLKFPSFFLEYIDYSHRAAANITNAHKVFCLQYPIIITGKLMHTEDIIADSTEQARTCGFPVFLFVQG
ncbi:hypothetical protein EJB05_49581, partial [Eragrostis curvula]